MVGEVSETYKPDWHDLDRYPQAEWLNKAKFGMYWSWALNTVPGYDGWYGRNMYNAHEGHVYRYHIDTYGDPSGFGFKDFVSQFDAEHFSAVRWVEDAQRTGVRFIVGMAAHHAGFDMYDSSYTEWNSVDKKPHIDVIGELEREARKRDLKFGVTSHLAWNWYYFSSFMWPDKYDAKDAPDFYNLHDPNKGPSREWVDEWYLRTVELIDKYDIDFLWFDFGTMSPEFFEHNKKLTAYFYNNSVQEGRVVALATKTGFENRRSQVHDVEHGKFGHIRYPMWMADCTFNRGWFNLNDESKEDERISGQYWIYQLIDIVSKNGTLLLSMGPKADGSWPERWKNELFRIGDWLEINGEAIYETEPWHRYGEGPIHDGSGEHYDLGRMLTNQDIRFTRKGEFLYAIVCGWNDEVFDIRSLGLNDLVGLEIESISMLGSDEPIRWEQFDEKLSILAPENTPGDYAYVFKISGIGLFPDRSEEYIRYEIPVNQKVEKIRVSIPGQMKQLSLAEIVAMGVFDWGTRGNLAPAGSVEASSFKKGSVPELAIDRNFNGHPNMSSSFESEVEASPWIELKLKKPKKVMAVELFGALESSEVLFKEGRIEFYDDEGTLVMEGMLSELAVAHRDRNAYIGVSGN